MYNGLKIKDLILSKGLNFKKACALLDMHEATFFNITGEKGNPKADNLEKLADFLQCPIDYFLDRKVELSKEGVSISGNGNKVQHGNGNVMTEQAKEIDHLKQLLEERERILQEKERTIQILLKQNS